MKTPANTSPVFVLCFARSGSTLLRCILDAHPDYCCPPELHLAFLADKIHRAYYLTLRDSGITDERECRELACKKAHRDISRIMNEYMLRTGKTVWCEKSVSTIDVLAATQSIFPDARYICLYRNCLDMVASALDILQQPDSGATFGFEPFLRNRPENQIEALIEYWYAKTSAMLQFEQNNPGKFIRVKYESIANDTADSLNSLFGFLGSSWTDEIMNDVFSMHKEPFPGDHKIRQTSKIHSNSIGTGNQIDLNKISGEHRGKMNKLLSLLDYNTVST